MSVNDNMVGELNSIFASHIANISNGSDSILNTIGIKNALNKIFDKDTCVDVIYTKNTDNIFFGVMINPTLSAGNLLDILFSSNDQTVDRYTVEIDSKLFDVGLFPSEITAYLIYEISALIDSSAPIWEVRKIIDLYIANEDEVIDIKNSVNYSQILIFAIKDALIKVSSVKYRDNEGILSNEFVNKNEEIRDNLVSALNKIRSSTFGIGAVVKEPNLVLLEWAFNLYRDAIHYANVAIDTLEKAKISTASKLQIAEINKTIKSLQRVGFDIATESANILAEAKHNGTLFANLKKNGLRSIEDDLYEFAVRTKNAESEEDIYYALRQINTRLNLLEDYIYNTEGLSEREIERWADVARRYRALREELGKKKINKKNYGLFYDYDKLDDLD